MHTRLELALLLYEVFRRQGLVREAHVHHTGRVAFRRGQIYESAFAQNNYAPATLAQLEL